MSAFRNPELNAAGTTPLYQQLYEYLRAAILSGQLEPGAKLPSTRALADTLAISRNTVLNAYDQLFAEGYLENIGGKGTFVANLLPETAQMPTPKRTNRAKSSPASPAPPRLSERAQTLMQTAAMPGARPGVRKPHAFLAGSPALDKFPYKLWTKLVTRHANALHPGVMMYQDAAGYRPLREAIADHVILARQVRCQPEQVIIVSGSQAGIYLAARVLLNPADRVWMEDPGYLGARRALVSAGAKLVPVPVDAEGLMVESGLALAPDARAVYLTPSHQFPLGMTMSLRRRLAVLEWARQHRAYILEDDYDSEYRYDGRPLASLQGVDEHETVIYVGSFSKVLFPGLRLGYVIVPPGLVDAFMAVRGSIDYHPAALEQLVLTDFITEGHFSRHIRRMRALYAERRSALLDALAPLPFEIDAPETGMHLVAWLPPGLDESRVVEAAAEQGVTVFPVSMFAMNAALRGGLLLGYAAVDADTLRQGVARLTTALHSLG